MVRLDRGIFYNNLKSWLIGAAFYFLVECFEDSISGLGGEYWDHTNMPPVQITE